MTERTSRGPSPGTPLSACIISFQEADRIEECVRSADFCDEVLVVDSGSTDGTRARAEALGARVEVRAPFPGHVEQKQVAVDLAHHDWILSLDADERVSDELREELVGLKGRGLREPGYVVPRRNHYLGRVVRRGLFWPDRKLRLFDRRVGRWGGTNPHDRVELPAGRAPRRLDAPIEHLSYRDFAEHVRTVDSYAAIAARQLCERGRRSTWFDILLRPPAVLLKSLVIKRGFVDGWRGFLIAGMAFRYDWLKYWRLRRLVREAREVPHSGAGHRG